MANEFTARVAGISVSVYIIQISLVSMYRLIIRISRIKELRGK